MTPAPSGASASARRSEGATLPEPPEQARIKPILERTPAAQADFDRKTAP